MKLINKNICLIIISLCLIFSTVGCNSEKDKSDKGKAASYKEISQEEAKEMMDSEIELTIVDVRRSDEYEKGHISGAELMANEDITEEVAIEMFPDKEKVLLNYCRSGNRSKEAAEKLVSYGYVNVYEFGGIITWPYEIEQ